MLSLGEGKIISWLVTGGEVSTQKSKKVCGLMSVVRQHTEGYWATRKEAAQQENWPWPEAHADASPDKQAVLRMFSDTERALEANSCVSSYDGHAPCRLCGIDNGCDEYFVAVPLEDGNYEMTVWPAGLSHYVEAHNVQLSTKFHTLLMNGTLKKASESGMTKELERRRTTPQKREMVGFGSSPPPQEEGCQIL